MVFYVYKNGMREKARVSKVIENGKKYEVFLTTSQVYKTVSPIQLRKLSDYEDELPSYYSQSRKLYNNLNNTKM